MQGGPSFLLAWSGEEILPLMRLHSGASQHVGGLHGGGGEPSSSPGDEKDPDPGCLPYIKLPTTSRITETRGTECAGAAAGQHLRLTTRKQGRREGRQEITEIDNEQKLS